MTDVTKTNSLFQLALRTLKLLSIKQRKQALRTIIESLLQALLEVFSLAAIIPLFVALVADSTNNLLYEYFNVAVFFNWKAILITVVFVFLLKNSLSLLLFYKQSRFIHTVFISLAEKLYHKFYRQPWTNYLHQNSAEILRRIKHSPSDFSNYVLQGYLTMASDTAITLFMLLALVLYNYQVVPILIILCIPIALFYYWYRKHILKDIDISFRTLTPQANIAITQGIDSFAETKIYQKENFFIDKFMQLNSVTSRYHANLKWSTHIPARLFEMAALLCFVAVIMYTKAKTVDKSDITILLGLLSVAMYKIIPSINRILVNLSQIQAYAYTISELEQGFLSDEDGAVQNDATLTFEKDIQLKDITFQYANGSYLFKQLNLQINKGDFFLIEGSSGVGKTTLIHLLCGLITHYEGEIVIDGNKLSPDTLSAWQCKIGFVPQAPVLLQDTILHNVAFGEDEKNINPYRVENALKQACLYEHVSSTHMKLQTVVGENGLTLSGGQRQRLILARALYRNPTILLLDEVTNQLDYDNKISILNTLKELSKNGVTVIITSHDQVVKKFATRIFEVKSQKMQEVTMPKA